jgi:serine protease
MAIIYHLNEWPLGLCEVKEAWELPLPDHKRGKSQGEGITIVHPDTGWTEHPELIKNCSLVDNYKSCRYLIQDYKISRNFITHTPTNKYEFWDADRENSVWAFRIFDKHDEKDARDVGVNDPYAKGIFFPSHGTTTASIMVSEEGHPNEPDNQFTNYHVDLNDYVTGIAPKAKVVPCRVTRSVILRGYLGEDSKLAKNTLATLADAVHHACSVVKEKLPVGVISISLGSPFPDYALFTSHHALTNAMINARQQGIIICAAAGQALSTPITRFIKPIFPGISPHTICVAGCYMNFDQPMEGFYGEEVDITAPGWGVIVARTEAEYPPSKFDGEYPPSEYIIAPGEGTSHATALTAGACALWQAFHSREYLIETYGRPLLHDLFKYVLKASCIPPPNVDWDSTKRGSGVLNAKRLLEFPLPSLELIQQNAKEKGWGEKEWGDPINWGRKA